MDLYEFCTAEYKDTLDVARTRFEEIRNQEVEEMQGKGKEGKETTQSDQPTEPIQEVCLWFHHSSSSYFEFIQSATQPESDAIMEDAVVPTTAPQKVLTGTKLNP